MQYDSSEFQAVTTSLGDRYQLYHEHIKKYAADAECFAKIQDDTQRQTLLPPERLEAFKHAHTVYTNARKSMADIQESVAQLTRRLFDLDASLKAFDESVNIHPTIDKLNGNYAELMARDVPTSRQIMYRVRYVLRSKQQTPVHMGAPGKYIVLRPEEIDEMLALLTLGDSIEHMEDLELKEEYDEFFDQCMHADQKPSNETITLEVSAGLLDFLGNLLNRIGPHAFPNADEEKTAKAVERQLKQIPVAASSLQPVSHAQQYAQQVSQKFGVIDTRTFNKRKLQHEEAEAKAAQSNKQSKSVNYRNSFRFDAYEQNLHECMLREAHKVCRSFQLIGKDYKIEKVVGDAKGIVFWKWEPDHCEVLRDTLVACCTAESVSFYNRYQIRTNVLNMVRTQQFYPGVEVVLRNYLPAFFETTYHEEMVKCLTNAAYAQLYKVLKGMIPDKPENFIKPADYVVQRIRGLVSQEDCDKLTRMLRVIATVSRADLEACLQKLGKHPEEVNFEIDASKIRADAFWKAYDEIECTYELRKPKELFVIEEEDEEEF